MSSHHHPRQPERLDCPLTTCRCGCRPCSYEYHCGSHRDTCHQMCRNATGNHHAHHTPSDCATCKNASQAQVQGTAVHADCPRCAAEWFHQTGGQLPPYENTSAMLAYTAEAEALQDIPHNHDTPDRP